MGYTLSVPDFLIEIGTEELPASFILPGVAQLREGLERLLQANRVDFGQIHEFATPRRLAVLINDVAEQGQTREEIVLGPPAKIAFDPQGNLSPAALGFAKKIRVKPDQLFTHTSKKGQYIAARVKSEGPKTPDLLGQELAGIISRIRFPKSMRWSSHLRFARPIRWLVALWDKQVIGFTLDGLEAGRQSRGHRLISPGAVDVPSAREYEMTLEKAGVIPSWDKRKNLIYQSITKAAKPVGQIIEDQELVQEVVGLVETAAALLGRFPEKYLELPPEIIIQAARAHQRYFCVQDSNQKLVNAFVAAVNNTPDKAHNMLSGMEWVLVARLEDARFYYQQDTSKPLESYLEQLAGVKWGPWSALDRVNRVKKLALWIADTTKADKDVVQRAAQLYLCDLASSMIRDGKEFTSLEGIVGMHYALASGETPEVARAIRDSRLPRFAGDQLPESQEGACVSLADKLDNLVGALATGNEPTPTKDPLGVRRNTYAVIDLVLRTGLDIDIEDAVEQAGKAFDGKGVDKAKQLLLSRFKSYLQEREGIRYDVVDAAVGSGTGRLLDAAAKARALWKAYQHDPEVFEAVAVGLKRVERIIRDQDYPEQVDPSLFEEQAEKELFARVQQLRPQLRKTLEEGDHPAALGLLTGLRPYIDSFFDQVFVMAEDPEVRANRLALVSQVKSLFDAYGSLEKLVVGPEQ